MVQDPLARIRLAFHWKRSDKVKAQQEVDRRNEIEDGSGQEWLLKDFQDCVLKADPECSFEDGTQDFTLMVPFFCGQLNSCVIINDKWALQMAKFNIEKYYSVVGVFERLQESLFIFEKYIPKFFTGASNFEPEKVHPDPPPVSEEVREMIKDKLRSEYELYDFISQRLRQQMMFLTNSPVVTDNSDLK
ncbi:unnamed protein product [Allacma fusca]|uniref:Uncharacterized protein n=1 Tax=Allacma fusca TaxID=39272 RepID=A0A8J2JD84_9HEXA|nr:unnamed protein product [Allacma fusca]